MLENRTRLGIARAPAMGQSSIKQQFLAFKVKHPKPLPQWMAIEKSMNGSLSVSGWAQASARCRQGGKTFGWRWVASFAQVLLRRVCWDDDVAL